MIFKWSMQLLMLFFLWNNCSFSASTTFYFLIDPGTNAKSNFYRFYNSIRFGYEILKRYNQKVFILAKDGTWILTKEANETLSNYSLTNNQHLKAPQYPPIASGALSLQDVFSFMKKQNIKDGDKVFMFITPHGVGPTDNNNPATARIPFWNSYDSYGEFKEKLKNQFSSKIQFMIVSSACYGGGIHVLSQLPNVCTLATVPFNAPSSAGNYQIHTFSKALWKGMLRAFENPTSIKLSLGYLAQLALAKDVGNVRLGRISSSNYIDELISKEPNQATNAKWVKKLDKEIWQRELSGPKHHFFHENAPIRQLRHDIFYPEKFHNIKHTLVNSKEICIQQSFTDLITQINKLEQLTKNTFVATVMENNAQVTILSNLQTSFNYVKKIAPNQLKMIEYYFTEHEKYLESWNKFAFPKENTAELRKLTKAWKKLNDSAKKDLIDLNYHLGMVFYAQKIQQLNLHTKKEQWREYQRKLECEWTTL